MESRHPIPPLIAINCKMWVTFCDFHVFFILGFILGSVHPIAIYMPIQLVGNSMDQHDVRDTYTWKIPEPAPFLSWHGAQIGGLRVFSPLIEITVVRQVCMSPASTAVLA